MATADAPAAQYEHLGTRTLLLLILRRFSLFFLVVILLAALYIAAPFIPSGYMAIINLVWNGGLIVAGFLFVLAILLGYLEYAHYHIFIGSESVKINRGLISQEEIGIPFRHIKEANIERSPLNQLIGASTVVLTVLGESENRPVSAESKISLPDLDKAIAIQIQNIILQKAEIDEIGLAPTAKTAPDA